MKKTLAIILAVLALIASATACGGKKDDDDRIINSNDTGTTVPNGTVSPTGTPITPRSTNPAFLPGSIDFLSRRLYIYKKIFDTEE